MAGGLWLRSGGRDFSLSLDRVRRVVLCQQLRCAPPEASAPAWWVGVTLDGGLAHPLLNLAELIGLPASPAPAPESAVVFTRVGEQPVGLVCERFRGIIPPSAKRWTLSPNLFEQAERSLPAARLWAGRPVLELEPERLFPGAWREVLSQSMKDAKENVDQLWELSELEQKLANAPSAQGYLDLADRYRKLGWEEEANRVQARAAEVRNDHGSAARPAGGGLSGPCSPRVLLEVLQVLRLTGKTGELLIESSQGLAGSVSFQAGAIVAVRCGEHEEELPGLRALARLRGGRYQFFPGVATDGAAPAVDSTAAWMAELERFVQTLS